MYKSTRSLVTWHAGTLLLVDMGCGLLGAQEEGEYPGIQEFQYQLERQDQGQHANFSQAISLLENARANAPDDEDLTRSLIRALAADGAELFAAGDHSGSLQRFRQAIALQPDREAAIAVLGDLDARTQLEMLVRGGEFNQIIKEFDALRREPGERPGVADSEVWEQAATLVGELGTADPERRWEIQQDLLRLGEISVPHLLPMLRNPRDDLLRSYAIATLIRMRGDSVLPIIQGLESDSELQRLNVAIVLNAIGDPRALAALQRVTEAPQETPRVKAEARKAMVEILAGGTPTHRAAEYYWRKALDYYHEKESAVRSFDDQWIIWRWSTAEQNVVGEDVPRYAYNERLAEEALLDLLGQPLEDAARRAALALLVAVYINQYQEASDLADLAEDSGAAGFAGAEERLAALHQARVLAQAGGSDLLGDVILRSVSDGYAHTSIGAIDALVAVRGPVEALGPALVASDKRVRYRAATAALTLNPGGHPFSNREHVIPNLVDALGEVGVRAVLVIEPDTAVRNRAIAALRELNYNPYGAASGLRGLARATQYPKADLILVSDALPDVDPRTVCSRISADFRTAGTPIAVLSDLEKVALNDSDFVSSGLAQRVISKGTSGPLLQGELEMLLENARDLDAGRQAANEAAQQAAEALASVDAATTSYPLQQAVPGLLTSVEQQGDAVRVPALQALRAFGDDSGLRVVRAVLTDEEASVDAKCAAALAMGSIHGRMGTIPAETINLLADLMADLENDPALRDAAGAALGEAPLSPAQRLEVLRDRVLHPQD